ncbi:GNAT family N-acetyltransferase [Bacteriovorax sp. PP10]|uniref:GNAT family N-acetyltransferase n=1 Tax=Bacteriovorax antarcticus TaxID=3088717 RepID=A0ABU5VV98_9BACT|nr:GNAT family N-acetyltransferase [Bacteriovorax sp. PP10]MEA9356973.1 GNAT family N-acetyltransferase [Bacteriovorax sp. PP10]
MNTITLRELRLSDKAAFSAASNELWESHFIFAHYFESIAHNSFEKYVEVLPLFSKGKLIPSEHVPSTILFAFNSHGKIVGRVSIRHTLSEALMIIGGHVGYGVVPSERRKGYATQILSESILYIKLHFPQLDRILVTCDESNIASAKTIEKNGGVLENITEDHKKRYWIDL